MTVLDFEKVGPRLPIGTTRSWDSHPGLDWSDINSNPGQYDLKQFNDFIRINQSRDTEIVYTLGRTPPWASSRPDAPGTYGPGQCAPPKRLEDWDKYVNALATEAAGHIRYWELWNEADDPEFYCGDIPTMVTLAQHASAIIKNIDPSAKILSPSVTGSTGPAWLGSFLSAGGASYVDIVSFHGYWSATAEDIIPVVASYRKIMKDTHVDSKPLWDTEASWAGIGSYSITDYSKRSAFLAKYYLLHWSLGIPRFVWYAYDGGQRWGGLWDKGAGLHRDGVAYREIYKWMVGASMNEPCSEDRSGTWTCDLERSGGYHARAIWNSRSSVRYSVPARFRGYRDLDGKTNTVLGRSITVRDEPILLETGIAPAL